MHRPSVRRRLALALPAFLLLLPALSSAQPAAPRIEAETLDGTPFSAADQRGNVLLVSVWSPESLSSRKCIAELQRFAHAYATRGVRVFAASALDDSKALRAFVAERRLTLPVGVLKENDLGRLDEVRMPYLYVFDRDGNLRAARTGLYSYRILEDLTLPLLP